MHSMLLTSDKDLMGAISIISHMEKRANSVYSPPCSMKMRFRESPIIPDFQKCPPWNRKPLSTQYRQNIDVGAGSGCHTLALQER